MSEPIILVTGATDGIGRQTALELLRRGARVLVHGRSRARAEEACAALLREAGTKAAEPFAADLGSLAEVRELAAAVAAAHPAIDVLVNNAGVFMNERLLSADGFEMTLAVNHLAPFLLTHLLLPALQAGPQGRVVNLSSVAHSRGHIDLTDLNRERGFSGYGAYAASKLANVLFTFELARRLSDTAVTVNAVHPGVVGTKLLRTGFGMGGVGLAEGAATSVRVATDPLLSRVTGRYFADGREAPAAAQAQDRELQRRFYEKSALLTQVTPLPPRIALS